MQSINLIQSIIIVLIMAIIIVLFAIKEGKKSIKQSKN
jgi:hypothetical protein